MVDPRDRGLRARLRQLFNLAVNAVLVAVFALALSARGLDKGPSHEQELQDVDAEVVALERMP